MSWQKLLLRLLKKYRGHKANGRLIEQVEQLVDENISKQLAKTSAADSFENYDLDAKDLKQSLRKTSWPGFLQPEKFQHIYAMAGFSHLFG